MPYFDPGMGYNTHGYGWNPDEEDEDSWELSEQQYWDELLTQEELNEKRR